jgi:hypothetical protein
MNTDTDTPHGPYTGTGLPPEVRNEVDRMRWVHCDEHHLSPYMDGALVGIRMHEVCGFDSLDALERWFEPHWRAAMDRVGFVVHLYEVAEEHARVGSDGQTVFHAKEAELVGTEPLRIEENV